MLEHQSPLEDTERSSASSSKLIHGSSKKPHDDDTTTSSFTTKQASFHATHYGKKGKFWEIFYILYYRNTRRGGYNVRYIQHRNSVY